MGMFNNLFRSSVPETRSCELFNTDPLPPADFSEAEYGSSSVPTDVAMAVPAFHAAVRAISESVAGLPWGIYNRTPEGNIPYKDHPYNFLLGQRPNRWQTSYEFRECMVSACVIYGNSYALKRYGTDGLVAELVPIHPLYMTPRELENKEIVYDYMGQTGESGRFTSSQICHMRYMTDNGWRGIVPLNLLTPVLRLARTMDISARSFWENDAKPSIILESSQPIPIDAMKQLKAQWAKQFRGPTKTGSTCVLPNGISVTEMRASTAKDAELVASRNWIVHEIARALRVPVGMIGGDSTESYADEQLRFTQHTITPWVNRTESCFQRGLFDEDTETNNQIDLRGLMRGDSQSRAAYYAALFNMAAVSPNDIRHMEEMPPIETDAANDYWLPVNNLSPIQFAAENNMKTGKVLDNEKPEEPVEPEEEDEEVEED